MDDGSWSLGGRVQYVIIGVGSFALTAPLMWWALVRRLHHRLPAPGAHLPGAPRRTWLVPAVAAAIVIVAGGAGYALLPFGSSAPGPGGASPSGGPSPSPSHAPPTGGDTGGAGGASTSGGTGSPGPHSEHRADDPGLHLLSADGLGALGSMLSGIAAAATVCVSVYQIRLHRAAPAPADGPPAPPPVEPPPSEGYL